ncbi:MAG: hypothetical protein A2190_04105 [Lysobacterales bacterium RIFOXYA1_FULL_69_10]|nr:MAG: hypothetical protein A2190_04105 [Xanthomonadales bacterium RIFOXYA1_FULL_69_10]
MALAPVSIALANGNAELKFDEIREQQEEIRLDVLDGDDAYSGLSKRERNELVQRQDRLLALIEGRDTLLDLDEDGRTEAINTLEWIRATLEDAEQERLVCTREKTIGSNRITRVCMTVAERERKREEANRAWQRGSVCSEGRGCGGG